METNTKENGFEKLIVDYLIDTNDYLLGSSTDFNKEFAIDERYLWNFLIATQQSKLDALHLPELILEKRKFLTRMRDDIAKHGIILAKKTKTAILQLLLTRRIQVKTEVYRPR